MREGVHLGAMERLRVTPDPDRPDPVPIRVGGDWREVAPGDTFEAPIP